MGKTDFIRLVELGIAGIIPLVLMTVMFLFSLFGFYWTFFGTSSVPQMVLLGSIAGFLVSMIYFVSIFKK